MQFQMGFTCLKTVGEPAQIKDEILNHHVANASTLPLSLSLCLHSWLRHFSSSEVCHNFAPHRARRDAATVRLRLLLVCWPRPAVSLITPFHVEHIQLGSRHTEPSVCFVLCGSCRLRTLTLAQCLTCSCGFGHTLRRPLHDSSSWCCWRLLCPCAASVASVLACDSFGVNCMSVGQGVKKGGRREDD